MNIFIIQQLIYIYFVFTCLHILNNFFVPVGWDFKWCPVLRITTALAVKNSFFHFRIKVSSLGAIRETQNWSYILSLTAVEWQKYCPNDIKPKTINYLPRPTPWFEQTCACTTWGCLHEYPLFWYSREVSTYTLSWKIIYVAAFYPQGHWFQQFKSVLPKNIC